jgi:hypothetical protein
MEQSIKELAPTILLALLAVEAGCRKIQEDKHFIVDMGTWMTITDEGCRGCLATATFMQLCNKSGLDICNSFSPKAITPHKAAIDRRFAYGIKMDRREYDNFECSIDNLRHFELYPLLQLYNLDEHPNAEEAEIWLLNHEGKRLREGTTKTDLLAYADFIKQQLIPKVHTYFF